MAEDGLFSSLELDCFEDILPTPVYETLSDVRTIVLTNCYGRGKSIAEITIPRLPQGVPTRITLIPNVDVRQLLPAKKRAGRGRARILSHTNDAIQPDKPRPVDPKSFRPLPARKSFFELPVAEFECSASNDGSTDVDSFELYVSEEEDEGYVPILPSQRGVCSHPFGLPPKAKKLFNVKSADEFPSLGGKCSDNSVSDSNNSATSARMFPPLPPRFSKKVTNDIVFKPMKERKKKKRKENLKKSVTRVKSDSISEDNDSVSMDGDSASVHSMENVQEETVADGMPSLKETELPPLACPGLVRSVSGEEWTVRGENVIQVDGLPLSEDITEFESMLSNYGTVLEVENKDQSMGKCSIRVRYSEEDSCEFAVSCLHDSDCVFPDYRLQCYRLPNKHNVKEM